MGSHSNHNQVVCSNAMSTHAKKLDATLNETRRMITGSLKPTHTNSLLEFAGIAPSHVRTAVTSRTERTRQHTDQRLPLDGHLWEVLSNALSQSTRRRKPLAWSYGENDSSPWTPVCTLTSVLTNTSHLARRTPERHSTGCGHRLANQE